MHQEAEKVYGPDLARVVKIQNNLALASCKPFDLKTSSLEKKSWKDSTKKYDILCQCFFVLLIDFICFVW